MGKTIAIIPARGGSKRLPGKNIRLIGGLPLIAHSILYARANSDIIDAIYVSTDDAEIKKIAIEYGAIVIDRPENLSTDLEPTVSAVKHVVQNIESDVENIVLLQPTNPLRPENLLRDAFGIYKAGNYESLFTVTRNHHKLGRISDDRFVPFNYEMGQRSQDLQPLYFENGLLYISRLELILNDIIVNDAAFPMEVDHRFAAVDIDTQADFDYAEYLINEIKR